MGETWKKSKRRANLPKPGDRIVARARPMETCCNKAGCLNDPTWKVGLVLRPIDSSWDGEAHADLHVCVCPNHAQEVRVSDLINERTWDKLVREARRAGARCDPARHRTTVALKPLS